MDVLLYIYIHTRIYDQPCLYDIRVCPEIGNHQNGNFTRRKYEKMMTNHGISGALFSHNPICSREFLVGKWYVPNMVQTSPNWPYDGHWLGESFNTKQLFFDGSKEIASPSRDEADLERIIGCCGNIESSWSMILILRFFDVSVKNILIWSCSEFYTFGLLHHCGEPANPWKLYVVFRRSRPRHSSAWWFHPNHSTGKYQQ